MNKEQLKLWIKNHEGFKRKAYKCTSAKTTIGFGRNLDDLGITIEEADYLLENDIKRVEKELLGFSWYVTAPSPVKDALFNMCFNLGLTKLLDFRKMIQALIDRKYTKAAMEALNSKWAQQVPDRAKDIALMMRSASDVNTPNCS